MLFKNQKPSFIRFALILALFGGMFGGAPSKDALAAAGDTTLIPLTDAPPTILSIIRASADNTSAASVDFRVSFSEPVYNVDVSDFVLNITGAISGATIENVISDQACGADCGVYTVTVNTGSGNGTIRLDVPVNATINDQVGSLLANVPFSTGEIYTIKKPASVNVYIDSDLKGTYSLFPNESTRQSYPNLNTGAVRIDSTNGISLIASERVIYKVKGLNTSFSEIMALPKSQLDTTYWLPWYNNVDLNTQLRLGNVTQNIATVHVWIGGKEMPGGPFILGTGESKWVSFAGINNGPVKIDSDQNVIAAEQVIYKVNGVNTSFSEMIGLPNSQLGKTYWLPWYNNRDLDTQLRFGNVSGAIAHVRVWVGGAEMTGSPFTLGIGKSNRLSFSGINNGPVKIVSDQNIVAAERVIYKVNGINTSFTEMMAFPDSQLNTTYWLSWYNNRDLDTQLRFGNVSSLTAHVHVYIGGVEMTGSPFTLGVGKSNRLSFAGINNGPVKIVSDQNIVAAERVIYKVNGVNTSFTEMMGLPNSQLNTTYWLSWYNNISLDTQLRFGVP